MRVDAIMLLLLWLLYRHDCNAFFPQTDGWVAVGSQRPTIAGREEGGDGDGITEYDQSFFLGSP